MGPMVPVVDQQDSPEGALTCVHGSTPWEPCQWPPGGEIHSREGSLEGQPPMAPPLTLGFVLVSFTGKFTNILGIDCL